MRLIDADAIHYVQGAVEGDELDYVRRYNIDRMPTVDAVPVKHGKWVKKEVYGEAFYLKACSVCGFYYGLTVNYNFCPNCGAKMNGNLRIVDGERMTDATY